MIQVSVIIINYNTFHLTCAAIQSVIEKTREVTYEIIVVDNASVERDADDFKKSFPQIQLIKSNENTGFAKGNNLGIESARGECILLLNSDAALQNDAISITYKALMADPKLGVVTGKLLYPDGTVQHQCGRFPSVRLQVLELLRLQKVLSQKKRGELLLGSFFSHQYAVYPDWVWGTFFLFKKEILGQLPGNKLPDDFFMYAEDLQWCYIIQKLGYRILYQPQALILHHFSQSTKKNKAIVQNVVTIKNEDVFLQQHYGWLHTRVFYFFKFINIFLFSFKQPSYKPISTMYWKLFTGRQPA